MKEITKFWKIKFLTLW